MGINIESRNCTMTKNEIRSFSDIQTPLLNLLKNLNVDYDMLKVVDRIKIDIFIEEMMERTEMECL